MIGLGEFGMPRSAIVLIHGRR